MSLQRKVFGRRPPVRQPGSPFGAAAAGCKALTTLRGVPTVHPRCGQVSCEGTLSHALCAVVGHTDRNTPPHTTMQEEQIWNELRQVVLRHLQTAEGATKVAEESRADSKDEISIFLRAYQEAEDVAKAVLDEDLPDLKKFLQEAEAAFDDGEKGTQKVDPPRTSGR